MESGLPKESVFMVGGKYEKWATMQDGYILEWNNDAGFTLYAFLNGVSDDEVKQFDVSQPVTIRFTVIEDVCYFLFKFGDMPWADCPFSPAIYKTTDRECNLPQQLVNNEGISLSVFLIDSGTGTLLKIRLVGLGHSFSDKWLQWAKIEVDKPLPLQKYSAEIDRVYMNYRSVDLAAKAAKEKNEYVLT